MMWDNLWKIRGIEESVTYQAIVEVGVIQSCHRILLQLGQQRFGPPSEAIEWIVRGIVDPDRLDRLVGQLLDVGSWDELLSVP